MAQDSDNAVLYTAVYDDVATAESDLTAFQELHEAQVIGKYDAAVIYNESGEPHISKRADRPAIRVVPEWFGGGALPRRELHDVARGLKAGQAALIVVGEPTLEKGWDQAVTQTATVMKHDLNTTIDKLAKEMTQTGTASSEKGTASEK